ncbi:MAG: hypothetical protein MK102_18785 [Fuerstiella sp.]|nr:hypothetical protein [Fuerstiella sp.]
METVKCWCKSDLLDLTGPQTIANLRVSSNGPTEIARRLIRMINQIRRELRLNTVEDTHQPSTAEYQWVAWSCNESTTVSSLSFTTVWGIGITVVMTWWPSAN